MGTDINARWQGHPLLPVWPASIVCVRDWLHRAGQAGDGRLRHSSRQLNPVSWIASNRMNPITKRLPGSREIIGDYLVSVALGRIYHNLGVHLVAIEQILTRQDQIIGDPGAPRPSVAQTLLHALDKLRETAYCSAWILVLIAFGDPSRSPHDKQPWQGATRCVVEP